MKLVQPLRPLLSLLLLQLLLPLPLILLPSSPLFELSLSLPLSDELIVVELATSGGVLAAPREWPCWPIGAAGRMCVDILPSSRPAANGFGCVLLCFADSSLGLQFSESSVGHKALYFHLFLAVWCDFCARHYHDAIGREQLGLLLLLLCVCGRWHCSHSSGLIPLWLSDRLRLSECSCFAVLHRRHFIKIKLETNNIREREKEAQIWTWRENARA